jgi:hypothetical protein
MLYRTVWLFFWTTSIVSYVEVLQKTTTFRRMDLSPVRWMGRVDLLSCTHQKELVSLTGQTSVRRKQLINTRHPVPSVGDRNKITINDMIEICAKHAHVKNVEKTEVWTRHQEFNKNESKNTDSVVIEWSSRGKSLFFVKLCDLCPSLDSSERFTYSR